MVPNRYVRSQYSLVPYSCNDSKNSQRIPSLLQNQPNYVIFAVFYRFLISFFLLAFRRHLLSIWFGYRTGLKLSHFQPQAAGTAAFGTCCVMLICTSSSSDLHVTYTGRRKKHGHQWKGDETWAKTEARTFPAMNEIEECEHEMDTWNHKTPVSCKFHGKL